MDIVICILHNITMDHYDTGRGYGMVIKSTSNGTDIAKLDCFNHTTDWCNGFVDGYSLGWSISHAEK
jgi:hypothetical protein